MSSRSAGPVRKDDTATLEEVVDDDDAKTRPPAVAAAAPQSVISPSFGPKMSLPSLRGEAFESQPEVTDRGRGLDGSTQ